MQHTRHLLVYVFFLLSCFLSQTIGAEIDDAFIDQQIEKAQLYANQYTDPEFLETILNADQISQQKQREFNNTLFYDASLELGSLYIPMGIYNGDIQNMTHLGVTWAIEWWLHETLTNLLTYMHLQNLITQGQKPEWNKKIISILFMYALINIVSQRTTVHYLLHETPRSPLSPTPISSLLPSTAKISLPTHFSPQGWTLMVNNFFKKIGWLPAWTEHFSWEITKEFLTLVMWVWWHERYVISPAIQQRIHDNQETIDAALATLDQLNTKEALSEEEKIAAAEVHKALHFFVFDSIHTPFTQWLVYKTTQLSFWHTVTNLIVATPAWYRAGTWVYNMYNNMDSIHSCQQG